MDSSRRRRAPAPQKTAAPMVAVSVIVILVAAIGFIYSQQGPEQADTPSEPEVNPFEGLPPETPPEPRKKSSSGTTGGGVPFGNAGGDSDPFSQLRGVADESAWTAALEKVNEAKRLLDEAVEALDAGDRTASKEKGGEAQRLLTEALADTEAWEVEIGRRLGFDDAQYKTILRTRQDWTRQVMALKKQSGL